MNKLRLQRHHRGGFTLVELLVVVLIITLLATIVLFAMYSATEAARTARTRSMIARINDLLAPIWESYRSRRVPMVIPANVDRTVVAGMRVDALRELMRMELPDRKSDVVDDPVSGIVRPSLSTAYFRQAKTRTGSTAATIENWTVEQQGAECLYLILSRIQDGDTNGLEFVRETEITDVDQDGMPEIVDGWGTPIRLLRWAPGFTADVAITALQKDPQYADPDQFDPLGVRGRPPNTYYLYPLVVSAGPDKAFDLLFDDTDTSTGPIHYKDTSPIPNDPFTSVGGMKIGAPVDNDGNNGNSDGVDNYLDNITNHFISTGVD